MGSGSRSTGTNAEFVPPEFEDLLDLDEDEDEDDAEDETEDQDSEEEDGDDDDEEMEGSDDDDDENEDDSDGDMEEEEEDDETDSEDDEGLRRTQSGRMLWRSDFGHRWHHRSRVERGVPCAPHTRVFTGHCNVKTVKDVNFYGLQDEYVVSGSDCGMYSSGIGRQRNSSTYCKGTGRWSMSFKVSSEFGVLPLLSDKFRTSIRAHAGCIWH